MAKAQPVVIEEAKNLKARLLGTGVFGMLLCAALTSCDRNYNDPSLRIAALTLKDIYSAWATKGRPATMEVASLVQPVAGQQWFMLTNSPVLDGVAYHCRFGARKVFWPSGVMAITDEGVVLWIRDSDGRVTASPEVNGIPP